MKVTIIEIRENFKDDAVVCWEYQLVKVFCMFCCVILDMFSYPVISSCPDRIQNRPLCVVYQPVVRELPTERQNKACQ
jgi:hypothetical protein